MTATFSDGMMSNFWFLFGPFFLGMRLYYLDNLKKKKIKPTAADQSLLGPTAGRGSDGEVVAAKGRN